MALSFVSLLCELISELFIVRGNHVSVGIGGYWYQEESVDIGISGYRCQCVYVVSSSLGIGRYLISVVISVSGYWYQRLLVSLVISIIGYRFQWLLV